MIRSALSLVAPWGIWHTRADAAARPDGMIRVWSLPTRLMHWTLASAFVAAMYTRDSEMLRDIHVDAGYIAGAVIVLRWVLGFLLRDFSAFRRFPPNPVAGLHYLWNLVRGKAKRYIGHNPAGAIAIYGMLTLGLLTVVSGYMSFNDLTLFEIDGDLVQEFHSAVAYAWFGLICMHLLGVAAGSIAHRENLPLAMVTGKKKRRLLPEKLAQAAEAALPDFVRRQYVEEAAYYIAERRGFQAGQDWDNWLEAEREVDRRLQA